MKKSNVIDFVSAKRQIEEERAWAERDMATYEFAQSMFNMFEGLQLVNVSLYMRDNPDDRA